MWTKTLLLSVIATLSSYCVSFYMGWTTFENTSLLEILAVFTSYMCTLMCVYQTRWNYPVGVLTTFLYSWLFFKWEMYALAVFNLYLVFSLTYGWFRWGPDSTTRPVSKIEPIWWLGYGSIGAVILVALLTTNYVFGVSITYTEIVITVLSGVAQFMLDNKKIENWYVWFFVNILSIYFYFNGGLYLVSLQYMFFLANTVYGFYHWRSAKWMA